MTSSSKEFLQMHWTLTKRTKCLVCVRVHVCVCAHVCVRDLTRRGLLRVQGRGARHGNSAVEYSAG